MPAGVVAEALKYLVAGGPANLTELARFLSDTVLLTGEGFLEPRPMPEYGVHGSRPWRDGRPTVGVLFYRAHHLSGNTAFVEPDLVTGTLAWVPSPCPVPDIRAGRRLRPAWSRC